MNMNKQPFSRIIALVLSVALVFTMIPFTVSVKAAGCTHEHDAECGYVEGHYVTDDDLEDSDIKDDELEDVELENDYVEGMPATSANMEGRYVEGTPCRHVCDENCGGLVDSGKMPGKSGEESELVVVAEFDELDEYRLYQGYDYGEITSQDDLILPDTLTGKDADGEAITIENVTWKSEPGFDPAVSAFYDFTPVLPQGYILAEDATAPVISVFIRPEGGLQINPLVSITGNTVTISETDAVADIKAAIQGLWSTYNTVIVEGIKNNADSYLSLNIPTGMTVKWQATYSDSSGSGDLISLQGGGTFEVDGGSLTSTRPNCSAIYVLGPNSVIVTDGTVSAVGMRTINLLVASSTVTINGGEVKYTGTDTGTAAIYVGPNATNNVVTVNGGTVTGEGNNYGIYLGNDSSAVAMTGGTVQSIGRQAINLGSGVVYYSDGNITGSSDTNRIRNDGTAKGFYTGNNSGLFNNFPPVRLSDE